MVLDKKDLIEINKIIKKSAEETKKVLRKEIKLSAEKTKGEIISALTREIVDQAEINREMIKNSDKKFNNHEKRIVHLERKVGVSG